MEAVLRKATMTFFPTEKITEGNFWVFPKIGVSQNGWFIMENIWVVVANSKIFWEFSSRKLGKMIPILTNNILQRGLVQPPTRNGWNCIRGGWAPTPISWQRTCEQWKKTMPGNSAGDLFGMVKFVTLSMAIRDLQRFWIKRSQIESPGGCLGYIGDYTWLYYPVMWGLFHHYKDPY